MIIDFVTILKCDVRDSLATKLAIFYYRTICGHRCRLTIFAPHGKKFKHNLEWADEFCFCRFNDSDKLFVQHGFLTKFLHFCKGIEKDSSSIYIDTGKIVKDLTINQTEADICVPNRIGNQKLIRHVNKQLAHYCTAPLLEEELILYDFSAVYLTSSACDFFRMSVELIIGKYPDYISEETGYAILSCIAVQAHKLGMTFECLNLEVLDIRNNDQIDTFYAI